MSVATQEELGDALDYVLDPNHTYHQSFNHSYNNTSASTTNVHNASVDEQNGGTWFAVYAGGT